MQVDPCAQRLQRLQVQVHRPGADRAAARQRDLRLSGPGQQRPQHIERCPHLAHQIIGRKAADDLTGGQHGLRAVGALAFHHLRAQPLQQFAQEPGIRQPRHVGQPQRLVGQQAGRHQFDGRVLGAADRDLSLKACAAGDGDPIQSTTFETGVAAAGSARLALSSVTAMRRKGHQSEASSSGRSFAAGEAAPPAALRRRRLARSALARSASRLAFATVCRPDASSMLRRCVPQARASRRAGRFWLHDAAFPRYSARLRRRSSVVERILGKAEVVGSIPPGGTISGESGSAPALLIHPTLTRPASGALLLPGQY